MDTSGPPIKLDLARLERIAQHLPVSGDLALITLKGHLLAEEMLDAIIAAHCRKPEILASTEIGFYVKVQLAKALDGNEAGNFMWELIEALNALRNQLAHKLESPKAKARLDKFLALAESHIDEFPATGDDVARRLRLTISFTLGCLNFLELHAKRVNGSAGHSADA